MIEKAAIWLRVSDPAQRADNQLPDIQAWADRRGLEITKIYELQESAWQYGMGSMPRPLKAWVIEW